MTKAFQWYIDTVRKCFEKYGKLYKAAAEYNEHMHTYRFVISIDGWYAVKEMEERVLYRALYASMLLGHPPKVLAKQIVRELVDRMLDQYTRSVDDDD